MWLFSEHAYLYFKRDSELMRCNDREPNKSRTTKPKVHFSRNNLLDPCWLASIPIPFQFYCLSEWCQWNRQLE